MARTLTPAMLVLVLALASVGCACGGVPAVLDGGGRDAPSEDAATRFDAGRDAGPDDAGPARDVGPRPAFRPCGTRTPDPARCVVQTPEATAGCDGEGVVVFDGTWCRAAEGIECSGAAGAFRSFEDCAVSCELAGYCNDPPTVEVNDGTTLPTCVRPVEPAEPCFRVEIDVSVDLAGCNDLAIDLGCTELGPHNWGCAPPIEPAPPPATRSEEFRLFRQLSLLPGVNLHCARFIE